MTGPRCVCTYVEPACRYQPTAEDLLCDDCREHCNDAAAERDWAAVAW